MSNQIITILENTYNQAIEMLRENSVPELSEQQLAWLQTVTTTPERRKGVLTVLITSLAKKVWTPTQDVRQHQENLPAGYSGRTLDTTFITPFMRDKGFPHMAESGWLTRSLEQNHAYDKNYPGKITPTVLKHAFLSILEEVESQPQLALKYLLYIFVELERFRMVKQSSPIVRLPTSIAKQLTIYSILKFLQQHFATRYAIGVTGASRLPVLALYSIYQCLIEELPRYKDKELYPLENHTTADSKSGRIGDIEVVNVINGALPIPFEGVEVKFNIPITLNLVKTAYEKIKFTQVERYYILSTRDVKTEEREAIIQLTEKIRQEHGCEIIVNGIEPSLKYYLRLISDTSKFLDKYAENLERDAVIKSEHRLAWNNIVKTDLEI